MSDKKAFKCENCGSVSYKQINDYVVECEYCHTRYEIKRKSPSASIKAGNFEANIDFGDVKERVKNSSLGKACADAKNIFAITAILLGTFGVQEMMRGKKFAFIMSILFCWSGIPSIIGFIQGVSALLSTDEAFVEKVKQRENSWLYRYIKTHQIEEVKSGENN